MTFEGFRNEQINLFEIIIQKLFIQRYIMNNDAVKKILKNS